MSLTTAIKKLRSLNEPTPQPLRLPTEAEVSIAEQNLKIQFPPDYRYFLIHASDVVFGIIEPAIVIPDAGHLDLVKMVESAWEAGVPKNYLPFCEDNADFYCFKPAGQIIFWSHNGENQDSWSDLAHWIQEVWIDESL